MATAPVKFDPTKAVEAARSVPRSKIRDYTAYWRMLRRTMSVEGVHGRYLYSFCSVNNGVPGHLRAYRYVRRFPPGFSSQMSERQFIARLRRAGVGGQFEVRGAGMYRFDQMFTLDPETWAPARPDPAARDRLMDRLHGLGRAKTAFALELTDPFGCTAVCHDRHMLRLYGLSADGSGSKVTDAYYTEAEAHWAGLAKDRGTSPFILRSVWWDRRANHDTCRWWSYMFEPWFDSYAWAGVSGFGGLW